MKDKTVGVAIKEFVGWLLVKCQAKVYSYLINDNSEHKKAKGVNRNVFVN